MTPSQLLFRRALHEKLAFVPMSPEDQQAQASGPGGAAVDPGAAGAAGAPMDPAAAPMDPTAGGAPSAPPADPAADPAAAGAPPAPPMDPAMDPAASAAPVPPTEPPVNEPGTDIDNDGKPDTMVPLSGMKDFAVGLIEAMKGKKTQDALPPEEKPAPGGPMGAGGPMPGPVTGLPGDMSALAANGPISMPKTASILSKFASTLDTQLGSKKPALPSSEIKAHKPLLENSDQPSTKLVTEDRSDKKVDTPAPDKLESAGKPVSEKIASASFIAALQGRKA